MASSSARLFDLVLPLKNASLLQSEKHVQAQLSSEDDMPPVVDVCEVWIKSLSGDRTVCACYLFPFAPHLENWHGN
jgi:hypothetical protein